MKITAAPNIKRKFTDNGTYLYFEIRYLGGAKNKLKTTKEISEITGDNKFGNDEYYLIKLKVMLPHENNFYQTYTTETWVQKKEYLESKKINISKKNDRNKKTN